MFKKISLIFIISMLFLFTACEDDSKNYKPSYQKQKVIDKKIYTFGIHPLHNPKYLFEVYQPLVDYLNNNLKNKNIEIKLEASRNYDFFNQKLFSREFDFALPNPYQTIKALEVGYKVFAKMGDDENFRGIFLVRKDSGIKNFEDLKGKKISYPASTALAATILPQYFLYENKIDINKDIENIYVGSQESSIMNVYLKQSDIAATWPPPWEAFIKQRPEIANEVEIIWQTKNLPNNSLVARDDLPAQLVEEITGLFIQLHENEEGKKILEKIVLSKFEIANENTYKVVKDFIVDFEKDVRLIK
ncbi:phosphate/phosphite/phosphonate ABC transporter substrate-binding protein [Arcobacter cloacae]|uniref:Phosphonate ABC transporter substrate-binding protein n=1 Tax=Arcobacter cloacae TaxID=1054034 RepID=A0A6M8NPT7_9BACT|nr:phosphate/phosphite/phosphonate ABC transporter substrate-binding protein [Arcobacter cloacae]QKF89654.1 phosphonate ABC transporter, periplasmic substrate-binding protein [Arcobacter cloacae]RXI42887.1 phosphonate ABC transporter substrate-binding protein [Arcobacter cloacae]